jgi:hypothetical protein
MRWFLFAGIAKASGQESFAGATGGGGTIQLPEEPALDSRCVVTIRFPLLGPAEASFLFAETSQRGLSSSMSSFHAAMGRFRRQDAQVI